MNNMQGWARRFDEPIELHGGGSIETLRDALAWLVENIPKDQYGTTEVRAAALALREAAENGSMLLASISIIQAVDRHQSRKPTASRAETHFDDRKSCVNSSSLGTTRNRMSAPSHSVPVVASHSVRVVANPFARMIKSLGFEQFVFDQNLLWRRRLLAATFPKEPQAPQRDPTVADLLEHVRATGGSIYWKEGNEPLLDGLDKAITLGVIVRLSGATHEGITLTKRGKIALRMEPAPSRLKRIARQLGYSTRDYPFSVARLSIRTSFVLEDVPKLKNIIRLIFEPYRELIARMLRKGQKLKRTNDRPAQAKY